MAGGRGTSASGDEDSTPNEPSKSEQDKKTRIRGMLVTKLLASSNALYGSKLSDIQRQTTRGAQGREGKSTC